MTVLVLEPRHHGALLVPEGQQERRDARIVPSVPPNWILTFGAAPANPPSIVGRYHFRGNDSQRTAKQFDFDTRP